MPALSASLREHAFVHAAPGTGELVDLIELDSELFEPSEEFDLMDLTEPESELFESSEESVLDPCEGSRDFEFDLEFGLELRCDIEFESECWSSNKKSNLS